MFIAMPGAPLRQFASFKRIPFVRVDIEDNGKGISGDKELAFGAKAQTGIGIRGMRERLRQLNGTLEVGSNGCGTRVTATIPIRQSGLSHSWSREPRPLGFIH